MLNSIQIRLKKLSETINIIEHNLFSLCFRENLDALDYSYGVVRQRGLPVKLLICPPTRVTRALKHAHLTAERAFPQRRFGQNDWLKLVSVIV